MGKKPKHKKAEKRAEEKKIHAEHLQKLGAPPRPIEEEIGSAKLITEPLPPGKKYKVLGAEGYDDGGVADLTLLLDLDDHILRRKRGENAFASALRADLLPRVTTGPLARDGRRDQKIHLAKMLFSEGENKMVDDEDNATPDEIYIENREDVEDELKQRREARVTTAKQALKISLVLRDASCACISLTELSKRTLLWKGKAGAETSLRCADKALEMASDGFYDSDEIAIEAQEDPQIDPKYEKNATSPGLSHPTSLKFAPIRQAVLCKRAAYLHRGNALSALCRHDDARECYLKVIPLLENEPRSTRIDWEHASALINIGNTYSRQGDFDKADVQYSKAEKLGQDHLEAEGGNKMDGMGMRMTALRSRAFALKKVGREEEAKQLLRDVLEIQKEHSQLVEKEREIVRQETTKQTTEAGAAADPAA